VGETDELVNRTEKQHKEREPASSRTRKVLKERNGESDR